VKTKKGYLSVEHDNLKKYYKKMEQTHLKERKELEELRMDIGNVYQSKNEIER
jgi:ABC-type histidine transport system ATPase subunit